MVLDLTKRKDLFGQRDVRETGFENIDPANFNAIDFLVASNIVNLANKTSYWSCPGSAFTTKSPDVDDITIREAHTNADGEQYITANGNGISLAAPVNLPHGAVITGCIVYGNAAATAETWELVRLDHTGTVSPRMATANIGTADTSISQATVDNNNYFYSLVTDTIDINDTVYGAMITYTTDYD